MNTFRYIILWLAVAVAAIAGADTLQQRVDALKAAPNVLGAWVEVAPVSLPRGGELYAGRVAWVEATGSTASQRGIEVIVLNSGKIENGVNVEQAYWVNDLPGPLKPSTEVKYLSSRTTGGWGALTGAAQLSAIEGFCNSVYAGANPGAGAIREFSATPTNGTTIKVSGYFDLGTTWEHQTWYVRLIDANGSVTAPYSNIEFQRVAEAQAP